MQAYGLALKAILAAAVCLDGGLSSACDGDAPRASDPGKTCLYIAQKMYQHLTRRFFADDFGNMYALCRWSRLWAEAEIAQSHTAADRQAAAMAHLGRIRRIHAHAVDRANFKIAARAELFAADYYLANAEVFLAETKDRTLTEDALAAARRRANAVRQVYEINLEEAAHYPVFWVAVLGTSKSWQQAAFAVLATKADRLAIAKAYLDQTVRLENMIKKAADKVSSGTILEAAYYHADAEVLVAGVECEGRPPLPLKAAKTRLDTAKASYESLWKAYLTGPESEGAIYGWSGAWRDAALALAKTNEEKVAINEAHLSRMRALDKLERTKEPRGPLDGAYVTEYYIAEAEILVAKAKGK